MDRFKKIDSSQSKKDATVKTKKQLEPRLPRQMIPEEALVLFVLDVNSPPIDDDVFDDAFNYMVSGQTDRVMFGTWKVLRVPELRIVPLGPGNEKLQLPGPVVDEIQNWDAVQFQPDALRIVRIRKLTDINAYAIVICVREEKEPGSNPASVQIGGREYHEEQSIRPQEFLDFFQAIISENPGPVTIHPENSTSGSAVITRVNEWSDFTNGPKINQKKFEHQTDDLKQKGFLAFNISDSGKLECKTPFRALTPKYFDDFHEFRRCQDIPDRYFRPVSSGPTCFVSHRWSSLSHPDPNRDHFEIIRNFVQRNNTKLIWIDFSCLPQEPFSEADRLLFRQSIQNLNSLIMVTHFLSIISEDYPTRAWCFYEWTISRLFSEGPRVQIRPKNVEANFDPIVTKMVVEGIYPQMVVTKNADMADINELLESGIGMFKTITFRVTLRILNEFGFSFGEGIAARIAQVIDFAKLWMIWQILAGSSEHSGILLHNLANKQRLKDILTDRHERFGTHTRIYQELPLLSKTPLDLRIIDQANGDHLLSLITKARKLGPVPAAYSTLAIVKLVYSFAEVKKSD